MASTVTTTAVASEKKKQKNPTPWLKHFFTDPFYLLHFFLFFSYFVARAAASEFLSPDQCRHLLRREVQAILIFSVYVSVKIVREETWEGFICDTLFFAKGFLLAVALVINYHLALCYIVAFLVVFVLAQQPAYDALGDSGQLTPLQLEALLTEGKSSRLWLVLSLSSLLPLGSFLLSTTYQFIMVPAQAATYALRDVEFRTLCSSACVRRSRFIPELSTIYSNKNISFATVDLGQFPNTAERFGIPLGGAVTSGHLPTYILFDHGVEVSRLPGIASESRNYIPDINKNLLCRYFELDRRLIEYVAGK